MDFFPFGSTLSDLAFCLVTLSLLSEVFVDISLSVTSLFSVVDRVELLRPLRSAGEDGFFVSPCTSAAGFFLGILGNDVLRVLGGSPLGVLLTASLPFFPLGEAWRFSGGLRCSFCLRTNEAMFTSRLISGNL